MLSTKRVLMCVYMPFKNMVMDTFITLKTQSKSQLTEKRSRFLAFALPVKDEKEAKEQVAFYKKEFYDARHVCFAYVIGNEGEIIRANDDGEPNGTAGRPILGQIQTRNLTYTLCIVVRYFGGVKLGTGPLGVAYKTAIGEALDKAEKIEKVISKEFNIYIPYADADVAMRFVREAKAEIISRDYNDSGTILTIKVRRDDVETLCNRLSKILSLKFIDDNNEPNKN